MASSITSEDVAADFSAAEKIFAQHQEYQAEVAAHEKSVQEFQETAEKLIKSGHPSIADIREKRQGLQDAWCRLLESAGKRQDHLEQVKEVQRFKREADQLEGWLYARDTDVLSEDVGDSLEAVEELLKKQDEFEKILSAKGEHFEELTRLTNQEMESEKQKKEKEREIEKQKEMERQAIKKKRQEKERLEKERRKAQREEERRHKALLEEQRQQEEKKLKEERKRNEMKQKQVELELQQEEMRRKERDKNRIDKENKKILAEKRKEEENKKMIEERKRIDEAKIRQEQLSRQFSSPPQQNTRKEVSSEDSLYICEGFLKRKQEFDVGGQRAVVRAWKAFYTILADGKLLFYKDQSTGSSQETHASPTIDLKGATCTAVLEEANQGSNTFRLRLQNESEFLFNTQGEMDLHRWVNEINTCVKEYSPPTSEQNTEYQRSSNLLTTTNSWPSTNGKIVRPPTPVIKVTSFDSDDENKNSDDDNDDDDETDNDDYVMESFIDSPPDVPPPIVSDIMDSEPNSPQSGGENYDKYDRNNYENYLEYNTGEYMDILSEDDIHPELYPDAPTDFNDNRIPDIPCIPPPDIPPIDFEDLEEGMVDEDDLIVYPKAPLPPANTIPKVPSGLGQEEAGYLSSGSEGIPSPPPPLMPSSSKSHISNQPSRPPRKKRAPPPPREARYRSDSRDSDDFPLNVLPPKPALKPKQKSVDIHEEKKHEKKKGMFGFLKKKK
jgi:hypothetical protein